MANLTLDWLHLVVLLGAIHGLFLAAALAAKQRNRTANRLLAANMLAFSVYLASSVYFATGLLERYPHFFGIAYPLLFAFGPLIYLYARSAADRDRRLTVRDAVHALPVIVVVLWAMPIYLLSGAGKIALYHELVGGARPPLLLLVTDPLKLVSGVGYAIATMVFLQRHRERIKCCYSSTERVNLRWLLWIGGYAAFIWLLAVTFQLLESAGIARVAQSDDWISLAMAILVYSIGYRGLRQPEIFRFETAEHPVPTVSAATAAGEPEAGSGGDGPRYERSGLSERDALRLQAALMSAMDRDQPWKNSELTLADLAERLNTTPHKLSEVLNAQLGETFYDFVNGYRVREVQRRIAAGEARSLKMLSLALDAGFASKSTFNDVFKKLTGQTPTDYRQAAGA